MALFLLNPSSGVPIYKQLVDQAQQLIASGVLAKGERLPTVRTLAADLSINPMTVSKAYSQLEAGGLVARRPGVGMIVVGSVSDPDDALTPETRALVRTYKKLGASKEQLIKQINRLWEEL